MTKMFDMKKILAVCCLLMVQLVSVAQQKTYNNPVLAGFYPDPSIVQVGEDYYLINSTFVYYPGLPIFHSKDLVNWKQIGNAIHRPTQVNFDNAGVSRGLFAPAISYHKGLFYIVCTLIDKGGNFVITASNPAGPWSDPVYLKEVKGIDPSIFFDEEADKAYVLFNSEPPNNVSKHDGHRTIRLFDFDYKNMKVTGEEKLLINGGTDMSKKPVWIEGPHIFKKDGWYYMICAEGGTGYNHSEVVFRSKSVYGPFVSYENNPILTQRHLDRNRPNPVTTAGHADFVQTKDGRWYAVFLACRPYEGGHFNIGRETFMLPVTWKDGWPVILEGDAAIASSYPVPMPELTKKVNNPFNGDFVFKDDFNQNKLNDRYLFLRIPQQPWYSLSDNKGKLSIQLLPATVSQKVNPAFVGFRQSHMNGSASTSLTFTAQQEKEKAGLVMFQNEQHFYYLCKSIKNNQPVVQLYRTSKTTEMELLAEAILPNNKKEVELKVSSSGSFYHFYYATQKGKWKFLQEKVDAKLLSTETAGGFVGTVIGMYATSQGEASNNKALFDWFKYEGE